MGGGRLQYALKKCVHSFPFPKIVDASLEPLALTLEKQRSDLTIRLWLGLTDIYNLFHAPDLEARLDKLFQKRAKSADWRNEVPAEHRPLAGTLTPEQAHAAILELRALHRALDQAVLTAYAWHQPGSDGPAIDLAHDFQQVETLPENDRTRYTITPAARKELLTRLLTLNHHRAAEELSTASATATSPKKRTITKRPDSQQEDLFDKLHRAASDLLALPTSPRKSLVAPEKFLLVFINEFLNQSTDRSDFKTLNRTFHLLRHLETRQFEIAAALGTLGEKWVKGFNDAPPNLEFIPFLKRLEKDGWIEVDRIKGGIRKTARFPNVPKDEWRSFDVSASLQVLSKQAEMIDLISNEEKQAAIEFANTRSA